MNSSKPDENFETCLIYLQHVNGIVMFAFNGFVITLILRDDDARNRHYRKYLCCLQICSLALDSLSNSYAPIVQFHKGIFYSDSFLSHLISIGSFLVIELGLFAEVFLVYYMCVYYRRSIVLPPERRFNFFGWRKQAFFLFLQFYATVTVGVMAYFMHKSVEEAE
ncbi:hypothetical protein PMAYCL1PPCAC_21345, partial [Pristionchus mayeri]